MRTRDINTSTVYALADEHAGTTLARVTNPGTYWTADFKGPHRLVVSDARRQGRARAVTTGHLVAAICPSAVQNFYGGDEARAAAALAELDLTGVTTDPATVTAFNHALYSKGIRLATEDTTKWDGLTWHAYNAR